MSTPTQTPEQTAPAQTETNSRPWTEPVTRVGNLTRDPEMRFTPSGKQVCNFDIAYQPYNADTKQQGETIFYSITVWDEMAENAVESLTKGMRVIVHGRPSVSTWEGNDGATHTRKEITAYSVGPDLRWARAVVAKTHQGRQSREVQEIPPNF